MSPDSALHGTAPFDALPRVKAELAYLGPTQGPPQTRVYPPSSGVATVRPPQERHYVAKIGRAHV